MLKMLTFMLLLAASFITGVWYNERATTNPVSRAVHQAADRVETVRQDLVARQRHLESRDENRKRMINLADRMLDMMERQIDHHNKVAIDRSRDDN